MRFLDLIPAPQLKERSEQSTSDTFTTAGFAIHNIVLIELRDFVRPQLVSVWTLVNNVDEYFHPIIPFLDAKP